MAMWLMPLFLIFMIYLIGKGMDKKHLEEVMAENQSDQKGNQSDSGYGVAGRYPRGKLKRII